MGLKIINAICLVNIVFAKGGARLPIAHALRLQEPEIIFGGEFFIQDQIRLPPEFQLPSQTPSGRKVSAWKKKKNNANFSATTIAPRMHNVRAHSLRSHQ